MYIYISQCAVVTNKALFTFITSGRHRFGHLPVTKLTSFICALNVLKRPKFADITH